MDAQRWEQIQSIFALAAEMPPNEQHAKVRTLCGDDPTLIQSVLDMLEEDARQQSLLDADVCDIAGVALHSDHIRSLIQRQIGPYRLLRVLGEGGMGIVYLAERTGIGGLVAIKLLRDAWLSPMRRERFAFEQQTLVKLNHPSIARIYDANTMEDGTPWFVMEYADGQPLTVFLKARGGSVRDDLLLFRRVCEAVQFAHSHAIIHRDLKPSNILVTAEGEVKLLDFGIAKQINMAEKDPRRTTDGLRLYTHAYAAPEQRAGGDVGVFTDVYALGALLYEILTGQTPPAEEEREGKPLDKPSALVRKAGATPLRLQLGKHAWSELDLLCLTALHTEPKLRYGTVEALLNDITAYLEGRVLQARAPNLAYTARKFVRRNRLPLVTMAAALLLVVGATIWFTVRLSRARNAAVAEAARTQRIQLFTQSLFDGGDPSAGPALNLTIPDLLKRGEVEAESIHDDPRMQLDMFATLGQVYQRLGQLDRADTLLSRVASRRLALFGEKDPQYAEGLIAMGLLRKDQGRMDDAEAILRQGLALEQTILKRNDPAVEHALGALGSVLNFHGQYAESRRLLETAVQQGLRSGQTTPQLADDLNQLADVHFYLADYGPAQTLDLQSLEAYQKLFGKAHPSVAHILDSLGQIAQNEGRLAEAESDFRRSLAIHEAWYGQNHPSVAADLASIAGVSTTFHQYEQAQSLLERALAIQLHTFGPMHSQVAIAYNALGVLAYMRNQDKEAEQNFRGALAIWLKIYGEHHQFVGLSYVNLAGVYMLRKDYISAERMVRQGQRVYAESLPEDHLNPAIAHLKLGRILLRQQHFAEAEPETLKGFRYFSTHGSKDSSYLAAGRKDLIEIETHLHKPEMLAQLQIQPTHP